MSVIKASFLRIRSTAPLTTAICVGIMHSALVAQPGNTGFSFLTVSTGARNAAMGDVGAAMASNLFGAFYNPAALSQLQTSNVGFMHHEGIFDMRREFVGGSVPLFAGGAMLGFDYFKVSSLESRDAPTEQPLGYFDAQDMLLTGAYARGFGKRFSAGLAAKYAAERISDQTATTLLFDGGGRYQINEMITIGASVRNIGSKPVFYREKIDLPLMVSGGIAATVKTATAAVDVSSVKGAGTRVNLGAEKYLVDFFALRAGYKFGYDEESFAFGAGFVKSIWSIDYAFVPYKAGLGSNHRFAFTVSLK